MINLFKKISKVTHSALTYLYYNTRYIKKNYKIKEGKYAIVNFDTQLKHDDHARYSFIICMYLSYAGFKVVVKTNWREFKTFKHRFDFKRDLLKEDYIFVSNCSARLNTIELIQPNTTNHTIHFSYGHSITQSGQFDCIANYPMYPHQYKFYLAPAFSEELKKSNRTIKIFFAGDTHPVKYSNEKVNFFFNVIPRLEVIKYIFSNFSNSRKLENDSDKLILKQLLSSKDYNNEVIISEVKTEEENWLKSLAKADFFLCPPGVRIPWCHNCVEAMSVGAIPILEYGDLFYPHLENLKNCLSFKNVTELQTAIETALAMERSEIEDMRKNVLSYYNDYLSIDSIAKKINTFSNSPQQELKVAIPFISTKEEWLRYAKECGHLFTKL